ncbi:hypothetical protein ACIGZH_01775 [Streptomyces sp. NPDC058319]|uniref:hypothetical protein n=1 Tax=unclassified Streptomyces TaxID=2593676 RepID=UPI0036ED6824
MSEQQVEPDLAPRPSAVLAEPATVRVCAADYAARDQTGAAATQHGAACAAAQDGIPRTTGGR